MIMLFVVVVVHSSFLPFSPPLLLLGRHHHRRRRRRRCRFVRRGKSLAKSTIRKRRAISEEGTRVAFTLRREKREEADPQIFNGARASRTYVHTYATRRDDG